MTSGGQCVMTYGAVPMLLLSVNSSDMHTLEVRQLYTIICSYTHTSRALTCMYRWQSI